ncbi:MAG: hypothetical protein KJ915_03740 [Candidatus Omnitrophica bacterium]|nr:hypothetical protein [Candidatus Omnitrophota bacterium]
MFKKTTLHFLFVGILFSFGLGGMLTAIVSILAGNIFEMLFKEEHYYSASLLLTLISIALIIFSTYVGNMLYCRVISTLQHKKVLLMSSVFFCIFTILILVGQLFSVVDFVMNNLSFSYKNPGRIFLMFSLPLLRMILIPLQYRLISIRFEKIEDNPL